MDGEIEGSRINEIDIINMGIKYGKCIETAISESHTRKKKGGFWYVLMALGGKRKVGEGAGK